METKKKLLLASSIVGYVFALFYFISTACLFSLSNYLYWLTLVFGLATLYNSLYSHTLRYNLDHPSIKTKLLVNTIITVLYLPSLPISLVCLLWNREDKYITIKNENYQKPKKEKKQKPWYLKTNFILSVTGLVMIILSCFSARTFETSGFKVTTKDFKITKELTEKFNAGEENKVNGKNFVITNPSTSYAVTEFKPNSASETNPAPVVFVMPGFTRTKATMYQYAIEFSKRGMVTFIIDPGCQGATTYAGYETNEDGEKEMISSTVGANGLDYLIQYVYNDTERFSYVDRERFGAVGHSAGGGNVGQVAQDFSGPTYEESIIKSVYISGYIKVSLANRFKSFRCNAAMSYAYYDEGEYRYQGDTSAFVVVANKFINEINGKTLTHEEAILDYEYGDMKDGSYRVIHRENTNHCFEMYDAPSITNTINFFRRSFEVNTSYKDTNHSWFGKELSNGIALVFAFIMTFSLMAFLVDTLPFMDGFRKESERRKAEDEVRRIKFDKKPIEEYAEEIEHIKAIDPNIELPTHKMHKKIGDKIVFWSVMILSAIIACLDYIPLARLSMSLFPDAASNTYTFFFPARMMNAVMLWAVVNGLIGFIFVFGSKALENVYYTLTNQKHRVSWYRFKAMRVNVKDLFISLGFALFLFLLFYGVDELMLLIFHQDFRFMLISAANFTPRYLVTLLIYILPFFVFYISNSVRVNLCMPSEGWSEWKLVLAASIANSIGLVFILIINYFCYFKTGTVFYGYFSSTDTSEMWLYINMVFALIPMMALLPILNRFCYRKTGNVYFGAVVTCLIFIMMSLAASVSYIPM